jgi:trans-aconitate 2-methyltransferase
MADIWDAKTYAKFLDLRTKPARDLLFAIPDSLAPKEVCDLGCGPGNSTILLKERWPHARVVGLDSSRDMLAEAEKNYPQLEFRAGDLAQFNPAKKMDCIFANAALQWVGHHEVLLPKLLSHLNPGGVLAVQIPNNFHCPSHQVTVDLLERHPKWRPLLQSLRYGRLDRPFYDVSWYYDVLTEAKATHIQIWETEYIQEVGNHQGIFNWVQGTGLRPILTQMDEADQQEFEKAYVEAVTIAYPTQKNGKVLLPFRRLFMIAMKG